MGVTPQDSFFKRFMMKSTRIIIIGIGQWGHLWIENIQANPNFEIAALVDTDRERIQLACTKFNLDEKIGFTNLEMGIKATLPDAALIIVPPRFHFSVAMTCIENKLPILSEKPLANSMEEARNLKRASDDQKVLFMVSQDYRWQPPIQTLRDSIAKGLIGKSGYATYRHFQTLKIGGWREQMEEVIIEDMAIHHFDILRYITGLDCQEVFADSFNPSWSWYTGGATTSVVMRFQENFHVNYFATWITSGKVDSWPGEILIEGDKGSLTLNAKGEVKLTCNGKATRVSQPVMLNTGRANTLLQFHNAIHNHITPETVIGDNIKSYAMVRAALKSAAENQPVRVDDLIYQTVIE
jgi:predicted dehydrogenase